MTLRDKFEDPSCILLRFHIQMSFQNVVPFSFQFVPFKKERGAILGIVLFRSLLFSTLSDVVHFFLKKIMLSISNRLNIQPGKNQVEKDGRMNNQIRPYGRMDRHTASQVRLIHRKKVEQLTCTYSHTRPSSTVLCASLPALHCYLFPTHSLASGYLDGQLLLPHGFLSRAAFADNLPSSLARFQLSHPSLHRRMGFCLPAQRRRQQAAKKHMP